MGTRIHLARCTDCEVEGDAETPEHRDSGNEFWIEMEWMYREHLAAFIENVECPMCGSKDWELQDFSKMQGPEDDMVVTRNKTEYMEDDTKDLESNRIHEDSIIVKVETETYFEISESRMKQYQEKEAEEIAKIIARLEAGDTHPHNFMRYQSSRAELVDGVPNPMKYSEDERK